MRNSGTLLISLDFELHWGVFDKVKDGSPYMKNLLRTPEAVLKMLELFEEKKISATWAVVGLLFSESYAMRSEYEPYIKTVYSNPEQDPYLVRTGLNEADDPIHYAPTLIRKIQSVPGQEIATHTFSHLFCRGKEVSPDAFLADLDSAVRIAEKLNIEIKSIVFPRNQLIKEFIEVLPEKGIRVFRGAEKGWMYTGIKMINDRDISKLRQNLNKLGRFIDTYIPLSGTDCWSHKELTTLTGKPVNVPASRFLRPYNPRLRSLDGLKFRRIVSQIRIAAKEGKMYHLRWHPHNFGSYLNENMQFLDGILEEFAICRANYGMKSMTMNEYSEILQSNIFNPGN